MQRRFPNYSSFEGSKKLDFWLLVCDFITNYQLTEVIEVSVQASLTMNYHVGDTAKTSTLLQDLRFRV